MGKVGITGHLSGLGKELYSRIPDSIGFDIGSHHDIKNPDPWIEALLSCDVFINNAYDGFHQVNMLEKVFLKWINEDKTIINISSTASEIKHINYQMGFYPIHKKALDEACMRLQHIEKNCRVVNVKIGWMDTPLSENFVEDKLDPKVVADKIMYIIENNDITSMTIDGGFKKWKY